MRFPSLLLAVLLFFGCAPPSPYPETPGNIFLRQRVDDLEGWRSALSGQRKMLVEKGFLGHSLHQDLQEPEHIILTLKCSDLRKGVQFIGSSGFSNGLVITGGMWTPAIRAGVDVMERSYDGKQDKAPAGIVIVNHKVKDFGFWMEGFKHSTGGTHRHEGRKYKPSNRSVHRVPGNPEAALVIHEASDIRKAPEFMTNPGLRGAMEAGGVIGEPEIWYGVNVEEAVY